ncbi:TPA: fimbrial protein StkG [Enterobacter cloacae]|nr:fimbrial protein StkG [Enterobacter cloacae]
MMYGINKRSLYSNPSLALLIILMTCCFSVHADWEGAFKTGATQSVGDIMGAKPTLQTLNSVSVPTRISSRYNLNLTPGLNSIRQVGDDGEDVFTFTQSDLYAGEVNGMALFKTNVPGIAYALAIVTTDGAVTAFFTSHTNSWWKSVETNNNENLIRDKSWKAAVEFYQLPGFMGIPADVISVGPAQGTLGKIIIGEPDGTTESDHPRPTITIASMAFTTPIEKPTCILTAPKTVNLGDYDVSDLENDNVLSVFFGITGNCTNTRKITMTLTTSKTTGTDGSLLANTASSNAAKGVGVFLMWPDNSQVVPNSTNSYTTRENTTIALFSQLLTARLVKSGTEKVTSGTFSAIGTLQFTYE